MAGPNEPKKETVRIDLPPPTAGNTSDQNIKETVRIQLPLREPLGKAPLHTPTEPQPAAGSAAQDVTSTEFFPPPKPASIYTPLSASVTPTPDSTTSGPRKETLRIPFMPDPPPPAAQMKKPQPLIATPDVAPQNPSIAVAPAEKNSMLLMWILLGISALILIIQIWTYFS